MGLVDSTTNGGPNPSVGPPIWQIGADGGLLDAPVMLSGSPEGPNPPPNGPLNPQELVRLQLAPYGNGSNTQGTPIEVLVNNTKWSGRHDGGGNDPIPGSTADQSGMGLWMTDLPRVGSTEVWEFLTMTMDAHPIHIHLVQFQLLNRQPVQLDPTTGLPTYMSTIWAAAFPGGTFNGETSDGSWGPVFYPKGTIIPGYGPPNNYFDPNADGALGGNPAFSGAVFIGPPAPPSPQEAGWKDTVVAFLGFVTRMVIRWAPEATPIDGVQSGQNLYSFDPTKGPATWCTATSSTTRTPK